MKKNYFPSIHFGCYVIKLYNLRRNRHKEIGVLHMKSWKRILLLAIPSIASFASMTVTGMINLIMVGNLGALAIAIVGVSNVIMYNAWAMFSGIGHTVNYLVAQNYGSNTMKKGLDRTFLALILGS